MDDGITPSVLKLNDRLRVRMSDEFAAFRAKLRKMLTTADSIINAEKLNKRMNEAHQRSEER